MTSSFSVTEQDDGSKQQKLWGGRFSEQTDAFVEAFTASVAFDQVMAVEDIAGSKAHAAMLSAAGILPNDEVVQICQGLDEIEAEIVSGAFQWSLQLEDVHMNIEARLIEKIGDIGKKLHTGRSRNDQVATDLRLFTRGKLDQLVAECRGLQAALVVLAEREVDTILPGMTHLQVAQPLSLGHHLLAWVEMIERDISRFTDARVRLNQLPLGAAALAGTTFPIDRQAVADSLGFGAICQNSLDAVSDRDFVIEYCSNASILMIHLSRIAEELILWASSQFQFIELPDRFCTGSSIMPQKKNPDVPELVRGKSGRVVGHLMSLLLLMKSQPLAYNKDNQEDKEPLFDTIETTYLSVRAFKEMLSAVEFNRPNMRAAAASGFSTATDLADYLVRVGLPFRDAHEVVGKVVKHCIDNTLQLDEVPLATLQTFSNRISEDVSAVLSVEGSVKARCHIGGTAPEQVLSQVKRWRTILSSA